MYALPGAYLAIAPSEGVVTHERLFCLFFNEAGVDIRLLVFVVPVATHPHLGLYLA